MATEIEAKILDINPEKLIEKLDKIGAVKMQDTKLIVDWFRTKDSKEGEDAWYLRIRSYSDGKHEVTWKGKSDVLGVSRKHKEINFLVSDREQAMDLFEELGLETYAHQEKLRKSWSYKNFRFDLDQYPAMPAYLEIEADSEDAIKQAIHLLGLDDHKTSAQGERVVISEEYGLDWYNLRF